MSRCGPQRTPRCAGVYLGDTGPGVYLMVDSNTQTHLSRTTAAHRLQIMRSIRVHTPQCVKQTRLKRFTAAAAGWRVTSITGQRSHLLQVTSARKQLQANFLSSTSKTKVRVSASLTAAVNFKLNFKDYKSYDQSHFISVGSQWISVSVLVDLLVLFFYFWCSLTESDQTSQPPPYFEQWDFNSVHFALYVLTCPWLCTTDSKLIWLYVKFSFHHQNELHREKIGKNKDWHYNYTKYFYFD